MKRILLYLMLVCSVNYAQTSHKMLLSEPHYNNEIIDFFNGGRNIYSNDNSSPSIYTAGSLLFGSGFSITSKYVDPIYKDAFVIKYNNGSAFPKYVADTLQNNILTYGGESFATDEEKNNAVLGFWINRTELNGNGLIFRDIGGGLHILSNSNLAIEGYISDWAGSQFLWKVKKVRDNFSYLEFLAYKYLFNNKLYWRMAIYNETSNQVTQLTIYNPALIYNKNIEPFTRYKSLAEKKKSNLIGKNILYVGDSQYNDGYFHCKLAKETGANVYDHHYGGYRMAYSSTSWFYQDTIKSKMLNTPNIDVYFLPISSNDNAGGNTRQSAIDSVKYFYPFYGDIPDTITAKLTRFNSLPESSKTSIFGYQQTYSAYIEQIKIANPTARIIIGSIPISAGSGTMTGDVDSNGYGIWANGYSPEERISNLLPLLELKKSQIEGLVIRYSTEYVDLMGTFTNGVNNGDGVRLDFYNFNQFCSDGVHWYPEIKIRIADLLLEKLNDRYLPEADVYITRVEADGGNVKDKNAVNNAIWFAKKNNVWDSISIWLEADFGYKGETGLPNKLEKIYDLKGNADFIKGGVNAGFSFITDSLINGKLSWYSGGSMKSIFKQPNSGTVHTVWKKHNSTQYMAFVGKISDGKPYVIENIRTNDEIWSQKYDGTNTRTAGLSVGARATANQIILHTFSWSPTILVSQINNGAIYHASNEDGDIGMDASFYCLGSNDVINIPFSGLASSFILTSANNSALREYLNIKYKIY